MEVVIELLEVLEVEQGHEGEVVNELKTNVMVGRRVEASTREYQSFSWNLAMNNLQLVKVFQRIQSE